MSKKTSLHHHTVFNQRLWLILLLCLFVMPLQLKADLSGSATIEGRYFFEDSESEESKQWHAALILEPEYYQAFKEDTISLTFRPYAILDLHDNKRRYLDIRELNMIFVGSWWEWKAGISREFWSVTEFSHLVNIVNQTDFASNINEDQKLGQPMSHLSLISPHGTFDFFVLPIFRERTFPGPKGRFLYGAAVDMDAASYESAAEEYHTDVALRYSHSISIFDFAGSIFHGTTRAPELQHIAETPTKGAFWAPYYAQMTQAGLELQASQGDTLYKLESIYRKMTKKEGYTAFNVGLEHTLVGVFGTSMDLGILVEYLYDERQETATTPFANDLFIGMRIAANDTNDTQLLAGLGQDLDHQSQVISVELSRRINNHLKFSIDAQWFISHQPDLLTLWDSEDFIKAELSYYF